MRKIRFLAVLALTFISRFKFVLFGAMFLGVGIFLGGKVLSNRLIPSKTSYIGTVGRYHIDKLPARVLSLVGEGLTKIDSTGKPIPSLASKWESTDNGKTWVFTLDTNRLWHDGSPVTSSSIHYSFENVEIERPNEQTIVFKLQSPYSPFPLVVSHATFEKGLIGTGEWKAVNISVQSSYVSELQLVNRGGEKRVLRFYPSEDAAKTAFKLGQVDYIEDLLDPAPFGSWGTTRVTQRLEPNRYVAVFFNGRSTVFKDNKPLRQALSYAIDKSSWQGEVRALGPIPSGSWAYNSQIKRYDYDVSRAQDLLEPVIQKGNTIELNLIAAPSLLHVAEKISQDWRKVGVVARVQVANALPENYDAYLTVYEVSLDPDQYLTWHATQEITNITHFTNQRVSKLLEDGRLEMDNEKRKKIYLDFQRFLLEDAPAAFLYHPTSFDIERK